MNSWQEQALHHAKISLPDESCGLVLDVDGKQQYFPCKNLAIEGATSFTIDPEDWVKAEETGTVLHICHSHPNGDLTASEEDIKNCDFIGLSWFIFDPTGDKFQELKPKVHTPLLSKEKFIDRERTEDEKGLRKIKVYGRLAELVGWHVNYADVKTIKDVFKFINCNYPNIEKHLKENIYRISINNDVIETAEELNIISEGEIKIIPVVSGSIFFLGLLFVGGGLAVTGLGGTIAAFIGGAMITYGTNLAITGVTNMLFPQPQPEIGSLDSGLSETDARVNYSFSGIQNVSRAGVCVPIVYGEVFTGSVVVSSGIDTAPVYRE